MIKPSLVIRTQLTYFLPAALLVLLVSVLLVQIVLDSQYDNLVKQSQKDLFTTKATVNESRSLIVRDIHYIAVGKLLQKAVNNEFSLKIPSHEKNPGNEQAETLDALADDWKVLLTASKVYDQIRWIDATGQERIRLDYHEGEVTRTPELALQNKASRYYFQQALKLDSVRDEVYLSPFDLNIENDLIEMPRKPMIRIVHPVLDAQGVNRGFVVLNYLGETIFKNIQYQVEGALENLWLTNEQGYWLQANSPEDEWGFMYDREDLSVAHRYPEAWKTIAQQADGQFKTTEGLWLFDTVEMLTDSKESVHNAQGVQRWKVIRFIPKNQLALGFA